MGSESGATGGTGEVSSSTTSLSKDSVIHASPSMSIQSTSKIPPPSPKEGGSVVDDGAARKISIPRNETAVESSHEFDADMFPHGKSVTAVILGSSPPTQQIQSVSSTSSSSSNNNKASTNTSDSTTTTAAAVADNKLQQQQGQPGKDKDVCPWDHE